MSTENLDTGGKEDEAEEMDRGGEVNDSHGGSQVEEVCG